MKIDLKRSTILMRQSWRIATHQNGLGYLQKRRIAILIMAIFLPFSSNASMTCKGRFVNPITDVCWSCILPISIGGFNIGKGVAPKKRDTKNPSAPLCMCSKGTPPLPIPGVSIGFGNQCV
jgi:conjugal transfer pilus assembly protein TraU